MGKQEVDVEKYFEELYESTLNHINKVYEKIKSNKRISMDYVIYSLESDFNCLGILELCYRKDLKAGRECFYKATLAREWFFEQIRKKEYEVSLDNVDCYTFPHLYDAILSGNKERAIYMAELFGSIEVSEKIKPAVLMLGYGLKYTILDDKEKTLEYVKMMEENKTKSGMKQYVAGEARAFRGLVERDEVEFNEGLEYMLTHHIGRMRREGSDLDEYFATGSVALAMLAKDRGINITVKHNLLREEYLQEVEVDYSGLKLY
ncbi:MAG: immunity 49 family protein [Bacteroidales bacterium]|nr:immunity 49 family protein [Bacteroidales bacterium]